MKPGNAGGGKDPDFWRAFEGGEVKVIGKSLQTSARAWLSFAPRSPLSRRQGLCGALRRGPRGGHQAAGKPWPRVERTAASSEPDDPPARSMKRSPASFRPRLSSDCVASAIVSLLMRRWRRNDPCTCPACVPRGLFSFTREYQGIVDKPLSRQIPCNRHDLQRINFGTIHRSSNARLRSRSNQSSKASQDERGNSEETEFAHWNLLPSSLSNYPHPSAAVLPAM